MNNLPRVDKKRTGERIAELKRRNGYTTEQLADSLGLSAGAIRSYEGGWRQPPIETLKAMSGLFHLESSDEIVVWEDEIWNAEK